MRKRRLTLIMMPLMVGCFGQISSDSLLGVYAGVEYEKKSTDTSWTQNIDTITIKSIDSTNCEVLLYSTTCCFYQGWYVSFFTTYAGFCPTFISNYYFKFHSGDSLTFVHDSVPQPWPNTYMMAYRFYGKKIAPYVASINEANEPFLKLYPNPANDKLKINSSAAIEQVSVYNLLGERVLSPDTRDNPKELDVSTQSLSNGVYFVSIKTSNGFLNKKVIVQH